MPKLKPSEVLEFRRLWEVSGGRTTITQLARQFGITHAAASRILNHHTHKDLLAVQGEYNQRRARELAEEQREHEQREQEQVAAAPLRTRLRALEKVLAMYESLPTTITQDLRDLLPEYEHTAALRPASLARLAATIAGIPAYKGWEVLTTLRTASGGERVLLRCEACSALSMRRIAAMPAACRCGSGHQHRFASRY